MPTADDVRALKGRRVRLRLSPEAGGETVEGVLVGTLDADDGLVVVVEPKEARAKRFSCNYQHIATLEPGE